MADPYKPFKKQKKEDNYGEPIAQPTISEPSGSPLQELLVQGADQRSLGSLLPRNTSPFRDQISPAQIHPLDQTIRGQSFDQFLGSNANLFFEDTEGVPDQSQTCLSSSQNSSIYTLSPSSSSNSVRSDLPPSDPFSPGSVSTELLDESGAQIGKQIVRIETPSSTLDSSESRFKVSDPYPNLDPFPLPRLVSVGDSPDHPHLEVHDLLNGTPSNPLPVDFSRLHPSTRPVGTKNNDELVLLPAFQLSFENKWKVSNHPVDYTTIRFSDWNELWSVDLRLALNEPERWSLKKMKVYGLSRFMMTNLLDNFSLLPSLEHLEIDRLDILLTYAPRRFFKSLQLFSVDWIRLFDQNGAQVNIAQKLFKLVAPELVRVYLGSDSIDYIEFEAPKIRLLSTDQVPEVEDLLNDPFPGLKYLEFNFIENEETDDLVNIVGNFALLPRLEKLFMNLGNLVSASKRPDPEDLAVLKLHFERICLRNIQGFQDFYLNHVHITGYKSFSAYKFDEALVVSHYENVKKNRFRIKYCPTTKSVDYLDVLRSFYHLKPTHQIKQPEDKFFGFRMLVKHYPNLRIITLDNRSTPNSMPAADLFISFLTECSTLTTLKLYSSGFGNAEFYSRLSSVRSLITLAALKVVEPMSEFKRRVDFSFLQSFKYLYKFHTNLATRTMMPTLVGLMRVGAAFRFDFCHAQLDGINLIRVRRLTHWRFQVSFEKKLLSPPNDITERIAEVDYNDLNLLIDHLQTQTCLSTPHWLDDLRDKPEA